MQLKVIRHPGRILIVKSEFGNVHGGHPVPSQAHKTVTGAQFDSAARCGELGGLFLTPQIPAPVEPSKDSFNPCGQSHNC